MRCQGSSRSSLFFWIVNIGADIVTARKEMGGPARPDGARPDTCDTDDRGWIAIHCYSPLKLGARFSTKAATPSAASLDFNILR